MGDGGVREWVPLAMLDALGVAEERGLMRVADLFWLTTRSAVGTQQSGGRGGERGLT